jgi:hypothetical protein
VGIENNANRNFKDLEEMVRSAKTLKRNNGTFEGILIGPSMAPRFFCTEIPSWRFSRSTKAYVVFGPKFRGADRKPTNWGGPTSL